MLNSVETHSILLSLSPAPPHIFFSLLPLFSSLLPLCPSLSLYVPLCPSLSLPVPPSSALPSLEAPGFNPLAYQVRSRFQAYAL
jgi:hypothetical protein